MFASFHAEASPEAPAPTLIKTESPSGKQSWAVEQLPLCSVNDEFGPAAGRWHAHDPLTLTEQYRAVGSPTHAGRGVYLVRNDNRGATAERETLQLSHPGPIG